MSSFTGFDAQLDTRYDAEASKTLGADHWRVLSDFHYYFEYEGSPRTIYVPRGYLTDGASVPQAFWGLIPPWGTYGQAAVAHDILCEYLTITQAGLPLKITRKDADVELLAMMTVLNVPVWKRQVIYAAVRAYAITCNVTKPSSTPLKRQLEADWVIANPATTNIIVPPTLKPLETPA